MTRLICPLTVPMNKDGSINHAVKDSYLLEHPSRKRILTLSAKATELIISINELIHPTKHKEGSSAYTDVPRWKNILRQQGVLSLVAKILMTSCVDLKIPYSCINNDTFVFGEALSDLASLCNTFLMHACQDNDANRRAMLVHLENLIRLLEHEKLQAGKTIHEILRTNSDILSEVTNDSFNLLIKGLRQKRLPRYTRVLAAMCETADGVPVKVNQDRALSYFFVEASELVVAVSVQNGFMC